MTLRHSSVVVLVNASRCVNVVTVNLTAATAVMSSTAVRYILTSSFTTFTTVEFDRSALCLALSAEVFCELLAVNK